MAYHHVGHDLSPFSLPWRTPVEYYPNQFLRYRPNDPPEHRLSKHGKNGDSVPTRSLALRDTKTECTGDLGWTLDYATAWCFRHLVESQPLVVDTIDTIREFDVDPSTPYQIFEHLDTALFGNKLRGVVHLRWKEHWTCSPGTTSAPGVLGVPQTVIQLNWTLFQDNDAHIDVLLDALIHQMIHAYFLICCGAPKKSEKQDGRLMDALHFGVIVMTIRDMTEPCNDGTLAMIFHAVKRKELDTSMRTGLPFSSTPSRKSGTSSMLPFVSLDPRGPGLTPALANGQTNCLHDNRRVSPHAIKNWQVNDYRRALDTDQESKGTEIYKYGQHGKLTSILRLKADPSVTYVELVWDKKRIMVSRENALRFKSLEPHLRKHERYELEIPKCEPDIFGCVYEFINKKSYRASGKYDPSLDDLKWPLEHGGEHAGPPVYIAVSRGTEICDGVIKHIKVFKVAERRKFTELMQYTIARLWEMPRTTEAPMEILRLLYDDRTEQPSGPTQSDLQKWARAFLGRTEGRDHPEEVWDAHVDGPLLRMSNIQKIQHLHADGIRELLSRSQAFQDDFKLVGMELLTSQHMLRAREPSMRDGFLGRQHCHPFALTAPPLARLYPSRIAHAHSRGHNARDTALREYETVARIGIVASDEHDFGDCIREIPSFAVILGLPDS